MVKYHGWDVDEKVDGSEQWQWQRVSAIYSTPASMLLRDTQWLFIVVLRGIRQSYMYINQDFELVTFSSTS
jgi:hypothetical protein